MRLYLGKPESIGAEGFAIPVLIYDAPWKPVADALLNLKMVEDVEYSTEFAPLHCLWIIVKNMKARFAFGAELTLRYGDAVIHCAQD